MCKAFLGRDISMSPAFALRYIFAVFSTHKDHIVVNHSGTKLYLNFPLFTSSFR